MLEKLKAYCEYEMTCAKSGRYDINGCITRCYGAVMFLMSSGLDNEEEIGDWWDNDMHERFRELQMKGVW